MAIKMSKIGNFQQKDTKSGQPSETASSIIGGFQYGPLLPSLATSPF